MIKVLKSNKLITIFLLIICVFFIIKPSVCSSSCLDAISVWGLKVLPMLFPFFILTRCILNLSNFKPTFMDKFFNKAYNAPNGSFLVFFLSILAGYPMGAKLVSSMYENKQINTEQAKKMLSFCSVSGPMFMVGTVGVAIFNNYRVGLIIFVSNLIACLFNGFIYRGKKCIENNIELRYSNKKTSLADIVYDSLISILMVGAYIVISFVLIDVVKELNIFALISNVTNSNSGVLEAVLIGFIEITRGSIEINLIGANLTLKTILASGIIAFGGLSVFMQSLGFLKGLNIKPKFLLLQKITQSLISFIVTTIISLIFL